MGIYNCLLLCQRKVFNMLRILKDIALLGILLTIALLQLILKIIYTTILIVNTSIEKIIKTIKKYFKKLRNKILFILLKFAEA